MHNWKKQQKRKLVANAQKHKLVTRLLREWRKNALLALR